VRQERKPPIPELSSLSPLADEDEQAARSGMLDALRADPERYLRRYQKKFGNVLNADDAATLFKEYNRDRAKYRVAVHPAATWIRDELFRRSLDARAPEGHNRVAFTAGSNAAGKSTAIAFTREMSRAQVVFDSTFSDRKHAGRLVDQALASDKRVTILYINRPLADAFRGMLERAGQQGRLVTIDQMINSHRGAADTVRYLWETYQGDHRFEFRFIDNSREGPRLGAIDLASPEDYTEIGRIFHELLDAEYEACEIPEEVYRRVRGR
jgi:hypothetical protein